MAIGFGANCAKVLLIVINIFFILSGLALIGIGIWMLADSNVTNLVRFIVGDRWILFRSSAILLITMGAFVLVVSVIGFVGTIVEHAVVLGIYIALVFVVFAGEAAGAIIAVVYKDEVRDEIDSALTKSLQSTWTNGVQNAYYEAFNVTDDNGWNCRASRDVGKMWDYVQVKFHCCGVHDGHGSGYELSTVQLNDICPMLNLPGNRPLTCCGHDADLDPIDSFDQLKHKSDFDCGVVVDKGCADSLYEWVEKYAPVLIGIGFGIGMFELVVVLFAICLCQHLGRHKLKVSA